MQQIQFLIHSTQEPQSQSTQTAKRSLKKREFRQKNYYQKKLKDYIGTISLIFKINFNMQYFLKKLESYLLLNYQKDISTFISSIKHVFFEWFF